MNGTKSSTVTTPIRLPELSGHTDLKPASIFDVTKLSDERTQTLDRLLKQGHASVAPLREPKLILHSHLPHVCSLKSQDSITSYCYMFAYCMNSEHSLHCNSCLDPLTPWAPVLSNWRRPTSTRSQAWKASKKASFEVKRSRQRIGETSSRKRSS